MSKKQFITGAIVLSVSGVFVKAMGFAFRIPLGRMIGSGGIGDYSPAYDVYAFILVIATAGIPVAISKLVAESCAVGRYVEAEKVFRVSQKIMATIGVIGFLILFFGADIIASIFHMRSSAMAIQAIAPTLLFAPIMSSYRGYFQGLQNMSPTAISQVVEQLFRVVCGLSFSYMLYTGVVFKNESGNLPIEISQSRGAAGACLGAAIGAIFGLVAILIMYRMERKSILAMQRSEHSICQEPTKRIIKRIIVCALPITVAACIMPIINLVDVTIVMRRLTQAGFEYATAKEMFGELTGFAAPIIGLPQIVIQAIVVGLVPFIAEANKKGDLISLQSNTILGYRAAIIVAMPCSLGLLVLADPILTLFFGNQVDNAIPCLQIYSFAFIFLSLTNVSTAMLQGIGKQNIPLINLLIGLSIKVVITLVLSGIVSINVKGAAIGTVIAYSVSASLDILALKREQRMRIGLLGIICKPLLVSVIMAIAVRSLYQSLIHFTGDMLPATLISILVGTIIYGIIVIKTGIITTNEMRLIPMGEKIARYLG